MGRLPDADTALDGVLHTVRVIARAGTSPDFVEGDPSNPATGTPKPGTPAPTVTAHADPGKLTVKWPKVEGATSYKVQWKSGTEDYGTTRQATPTALEYTISGLSADTEYTVQVIARNASGEGNSSDADGADDDVKGRPRPGRVPTVTVASAADAGELDVSWTAVEGATGYKVQWKSGTEDYSDSRQVTLGDVAETTLGDGDGTTPSTGMDTVLDGVPHSVQVIAFNRNSADDADQDGPASAPRTATPKPAMVMSAPTVTVHADPGKLTVKWDEVKGATSYKVGWKKSTDTEYLTINEVTRPASPREHTISGLSAANLYEVRVIARNASGEAASSAANNPAVRPRPAQVTNLTVEAPDEAASRLDLSWSAVDGATAYVVECKLSTDATFTVISRTDDAALTEEVTTPASNAGQQFQFRVRAAHSTPAVEGPWSVTKSGRPRPAVLAGLEASTSGRMRITVSWTAPTSYEVDNYRVEWKKTTGEEYATGRLRQIPGTSTMYVIQQGLDGGEAGGAGIAYTVRVRAIENSVLGPTGSTAETSATVLPAREGEVTGVVVTPGLEQLGVNWNRVTGVRNYKIEWVPTPETGDPDFTAANSGNETRSGSSHRITKLTGGTKYSVRVTALMAVDTNDDGTPEDDGPPSDVATGTPIAKTPGQVVEVKVAPGTAGGTADDDTLTVRWKKTDGVTGYKVEWMSASGRRSQVLETDGDGTAFDEDNPSFIIPNGTATDAVTGHPALTAGTQYTVRVQAVNKYATTPGGAWSTGVRSMLLPAQVILKDQDSGTAGDQFVIAGANSLKVAWNEAAGAHSYKVEWKSGGLDYHSSRRHVLTNPTELEYEIPNLEPGTEYTVQVTATNALGKDGEPSADTDNAGRPQPAKVTGVRVTAGLSQSQAHELTVSWNRVPGADSYKVQWKIPSSTTPADQTYDPAEAAGTRTEVGVSGTSYTIPGTNTALTANTEYTVQVIATATESGTDTDGGPSDDPEDSNDDVTGLTFPGQVGGGTGGGLAADDDVEVTAGANQLTVEWNKPTGGADSYRVQWKTGSQSFRTSPEIPGTETRYVIQGLQTQREYRVKVYASNASGNGRASSEETGEPLEPEKGQVTNLRVTEGVGQLTVSWASVTGATGYRVFWWSESQSIDRSESSTRKAEVSGLSYTIEALIGGTKYSVIVIALLPDSDDDADSDPELGPDSDEAVGIPNLDQVSNLEVARVEVDFLTLEWDAVTGTDVLYKVQWKSGTDDYDETREASDVGNTTYTISPLEAGTEYTIRVLATKDGREGEPSDEVTATTKADPNQIANLEVTEEAADQLTVEWDEVQGANSYKVQWKSGNQEYDTERQMVVDTGTSHVIEDLRANTEYTVRVIAVLTSGDGPPSEDITGRTGRTTTQQPRDPTPPDPTPRDRLPRLRSYAARSTTPPDPTPRDRPTPRDPTPQTAKPPAVSDPVHGQACKREGDRWRASGPLAVAGQSRLQGFIDWLQGAVEIRGRSRMPRPVNRHRYRPAYMDKPCH